jgi:DNA-binding NarL/FixJ family response regulator
LADDHTMVCFAFAKLLEHRYEVVGCVGDGRALLDSAEKLRPDVVLADIGMPVLNGLDATRELKRRMPRVKVIILTMNNDADLAAEALRAGASAYLLKNSEPEELLQAIHNVVRSLPYVTPEISEAFEDRFVRDPKTADRPRELTFRQREVLQLLAEGHSLKEIAARLQITTRTARFHKARLMDELRIKTKAELVQYAMRHGVVS